MPTPFTALLENSPIDTARCSSFSSQIRDQADSHIVSQSKELLKTPGFHCQKQHLCALACGLGEGETKFEQLNTHTQLHARTHAHTRWAELSAGSRVIGLSSAPPTLNLRSVLKFACCLKLCWSHKIRFEKPEKEASVPHTFFISRVNNITGCTMKKAVQRLASTHARTAHCGHLSSCFRTFSKADG